MKRAYGHIPDRPDDGRDHKFKLSWYQRLVPQSWVVPAGVLDLFAQFPPTMDQGPVGLCTCCAVTGAVRYDIINNGLPDVALSLAQPYYNAGEIEGNTNDVGRQIRDVCDVAANVGIAPDAVWPAGHWNQKPTPEVLAEASKIRVLERRRVPPTIQDIRAALYVGHPVIIGLQVFSQFESDSAWQTGMIEMPTRLQTPIASHAMLFGRNAGGFTYSQNSWGDKWGMKGRAGFPDAYIEKYASDCWTFTSNTGAVTA